MQPSGKFRAVKLSYTKLKTLSALNVNGEIHSKTVESSDKISANGIWMVESESVAMATLESKGIYPFESVEAAQLFAERLNIGAYRVLELNKLKMSMYKESIN